MLPRRVSVALACAGATGALLLAGVATLPAAAVGAPADASPAPQGDPSPSAGADPTSQGGIIVLPTSTAPAPTSKAVPSSSAAATRSARPSSSARTSHAGTSASASTHASSTALPTTSRTRHVVTSTAAVTSGTTSSGGSGTTTNYAPPQGLPTDVAASQGPVVLVTSKAAGGKSVLVPQASATPDRKVGGFSLSSVLITTVIAALVVAVLGAGGLWLTHRFGTRLSQADSGSPFDA